MDVSTFTIKEAGEKLASGELTAVDYTHGCLKSIAAGNENLNAFLSVSETALEEARAIDARRSAGESLGPLAGIPVALKDVILVQDWEVTCGSQILEGHKAAYDATVVRAFAHREPS